MEKLTTKQRGDAAEHYVISMLGFNGIPAAKMPDNWPGYDLVDAPPLNPVYPGRRVHAPISARPTMMLCFASISWTVRSTSELMPS